MKHYLLMIILFVLGCSQNNYHRFSLQNSIYAFRISDDYKFISTSYMVDYEYIMFDQVSVSLGLNYSRFKIPYTSFLVSYPGDYWGFERSEYFETPIYFNYREKFDYDGHVLFSFGVGIIPSWMTNIKSNFFVRRSGSDDVIISSPKIPKDKFRVYYAMKFEPGFRYDDYSLRVGLVANFLDKQSYLFKKSIRFNVYYKLGYSL